MRLKSVRKLEPGDVLAKAILGARGHMLLNAGVTLTPNYVQRLRELGLTYVYIQDMETYDIHIEETVSLEVQREVVSKVKDVFDRVLDSTKRTQLLESGDVAREFTNLFEKMFDSLVADQTLIVNLSAIYSSDAYLYVHSMNVGIMASVLGMALGFSEQRLKQFGVGAMLHDIGKLYIDKDILDKPGKFTEQERAEMERHCELGYQVLVTQPEISFLSAHCALQHHEKFDGTGYPRRLKGSDIHEFGRLLAPPDVYDAMTSNRVYRRAMLPHEAVEILRSESGTHFDPTYVDLFLKHINIYPNGLPIELSNGLSGVVARPNSENLQRPVVLVLAEHGEKVAPYELNLAEELDFAVTSCNFDDEA